MDTGYLYSLVWTLICIIDGVTGKCAVAGGNVWNMDISMNKPDTVHSNGFLSCTQTWSVGCTASLYLKLFGIIHALEFLAPKLKWAEVGKELTQIDFFAQYCTQ